MAASRSPARAPFWTAVRRPLSRWLGLAGFACVIFGGKLALVDFAGSSLPVLDQWDAEGKVMFRPWLEGRLGWAELIHPHNEHRVVLAKLYALGLLAANGEWDARLETTANAAVHTACALLLLLLARRWLRGGALIVFGALLVLLFALPFSWENTLAGFQVAFYFLILCTIGHIVLTLESDRFTPRWIAGQVCGILALGTLASGFFASIAVFSVLAIRFLRERRPTAQQVVTAGIAIVLAVAGSALVYRVPPHDVLKAHGVGEFLRSLFALLAWPGSTLLPWAVALLVPAAFFGARVLRRRGLDSSDAVLLGLFAWIVLQCVATAYSRAAVALSPRYLDLLALNVALGFIFLVREFSGRVRPWVAVVWLTAVLAGLAQQTQVQWHAGVLPLVAHRAAREESVRAFLASGDTSHLLGKRWPDIPYPDGRYLVRELSAPEIRRIMPAGIRPPIQLPAASAAPQRLPAGLPAPPAPVALSTSSEPTGAAFNWRSAPLSDATLPILQFRVAGDLGAPGHALDLVVKSASGEVRVVPDLAPGSRWKTVNVFRPPGAWWIEASDRDPAGWFAFTAPVEVGRGSWLAGKLLKHHLAFVVAGAALLVFGGILLLVSRQTPPATMSSENPDLIPVQS